MKRHKDEFDKYVSANYTTILGNYKYLCFKSYRHISGDEDVCDMFNDTYAYVAERMLKAKEEESFDYGNYFYWSLKTKAIKTNMALGVATNRNTEWLNWLKGEVEEEDDDEAAFRKEVFNEVLEFINSSIDPRDLDIFKFRVLGGMSWPAMAKYSGLSERSLRYGYVRVSDAIHLHFKANKLNQIKVKNGKIDVVSPEGSRGLQSQPSDKVVGDDSSYKPVKKSKAGRKPKSFTNPTDAWGVDGVVEG
jgi:hypothetical protein